jgi:intein/homing endonuclease
MAALEYRILSKILENKSLQEALKTGLSEDQFKDPESRQIWRHLRRHWYNRATAKTLPSLRAIQDRWPSFKMVSISGDEDAPISALIHDLKLKTFESDARSLASYFQELVEEDPQEAVRAMQSHLTDITRQFRQSQHLGVREIIEHAKEHYKTAQDGMIYGLHWPWPCLTEDTLGKRPGDFIVFYARMKQMKCVCEGQRIMTPADGMVPIEDLPELTEVPSYTETTGKIRWAKARRVKSGTKDCVEVTTASGLKLRTSRDHLYMVPGGSYKRIKDLSPGDYIATARSIPEPLSGLSKFSVDDANFLGLLVGDGNYTRSEVQFTTEDEHILQLVRSHASRFGAMVKNCDRPIEYRITYPVWGVNPILDLIRDAGIHGHKAESKRVPRGIFGSSTLAVCSFLAGYLDTDGHVGEKLVTWSSASKELLLDVQHLLMRIGVRGSISGVHTNHDTDAFLLNVHSQEQAQILFQRLYPYIVSWKKEALHKLATRKRKTKRNLDGVPYTKELYEKILTEKGSHHWPKTGKSYFDRTKLFSKLTGCISRQFLKRLADKFDSDELRFEATPEVIWDPIKSVEEIGKVPCYDICIEDGLDPNFVVEGFVVHNTWLMLYCAVHDYLENNARVLIWSREMNKEKCCLRLASLFARVDYQLFKKGKLPQAVQRRAWQAFEKLMDEGFGDYDAKDEDGNLVQRQMILLCGRDAPKSMNEVQGFIQEYQPDIGYLDSFYHMETANMHGIRQRWHRFAVLSEDTKSLAEEECIPIVAVHQANRLGDKTFGNTMSDIADTDVLAREADLIMRVLKRAGQALHEDDYEVAIEQERLATAARRAEKNRPGRPRIKVPKRLEEEERLRKLAEIDDEEAPRIGAELALVLPGNREGVLNALTIHAVPGYNFELIGSDYSLSQIEEWIKENEAEKSTEATATSGKRGKPDKPKFNKDTFKKWKSDRSKKPKPPKDSHARPS